MSQQKANQPHGDNLNTQQNDTDNQTDKSKKRPKEWAVWINNKEEYRVETLQEAAEALTAHYNCPYVKFSKDVVYNIRVGRNHSRHRHIQILPVITQSS